MQFLLKQSINSTLKSRVIDNKEIISIKVCVKIIKRNNKEIPTYILYNLKMHLFYSIRVVKV